jgi:hypothetical protein
MMRSNSDSNASRLNGLENRAGSVESLERSIV